MGLLHLWTQMALEKSSNAFIYNFIHMFLSTIYYRWIFQKTDNFDADIIINNQENLISKGKILFRDGSFIYNLIDPYRQTIANNNGKLYVQDDDFQQVIIYKNDNTFFLQDLFDNEYESENVPCSKICFKLLSREDSSFQEALVSLDGDVIEWIRLLDIKDQSIFIKFENFKFESSNITYVVPQNYEIINNDWYWTFKK